MNKYQGQDKPRFWDAVRGDFYAMEKANISLLSLIKVLIIRPRFSAVFLFRCSSSLYKSNKASKLVSRCFWLLNYYLHGCEISSRAVIAPGLNLPHPHGVVIGMAKIGHNANILQHVTIGQRDFRDFDMLEKKLATVGDNVTIFVGAVIAGSINIGDHATIGANAVVTKDVPAGYTAVGVPARVIAPKESK